MALTARGRVLASLVTTTAVIATITFLLVVGGRAGIGPLANALTEDNLGAGGPPVGVPPTICPLTGIDPNGEVPNRPALAVKVENLPTARPQTGLSWADIVYEQPVEVGITRFIAVYQCSDASLIEPIRSARLTDADILRQFGEPLLGYSGAVPRVVQALRDAGVVDLSDSVVPRAYHRDPEREKPHDLYSSTQELYAVADSSTGAPRPLFEYSQEAPPGGRSVSEIAIPFSSYSDVSWRWSPAERAWIRYDGGEPHVLSDDSPISAKNVLVQVVKIVPSGILDVNGAPSPTAISTGKGRAYVLRGGRAIEGTWSRPGLGDITVFRDLRGRSIPLAPGNTWIELVPDDVTITLG
ncbi:MAG: DUF3048 domain-containing protein [Actinobacteria bacterium]|nr:DUF3048 domain-containing protein [Actinomycetota bacterium]